MHIDTIGHYVMLQSISLLSMDALKTLQFLSHPAEDAVWLRRFMANFLMFGQLYPNIRHLSST